MDINVAAVKVIMDLEEVEDQRNVMQKVQYISRVVLAEHAKKMAAE